MGHMIRTPGCKQKRGEKMKRIVMLMLLGIMLVSLAGCFWGGGGYDRGGGYDDRGEGHDRGEEGGGGHEEHH
jgi:hypothetical protein